MVSLAGWFKPFIATKPPVSAQETPSPADPQVKPADQYMLDPKHCINPLFAAVDKKPKQFEVRAISVNTQDPSAARMANDNPNDDNEEYQSTIIAQICREGGAPIVCTQETSQANVQAFARADYGVTGSYCAGEGKPGDFTMFFHGWGRPGKKSDTPWTETEARKQARAERSWFGNWVDSLTTGKLSWTGLAVAFDQDAYSLSNTEFRQYNAQRGVGSALHAAGVAMGIVDPTDECEGDFTKMKNAASGMARTDGLQIVELQSKEVNNNHTLWVVNTHLESFHTGIRNLQEAEFRAEVDRLAKDHPTDWVMLAGAFNGDNNRYKSLVRNPSFAEGRCIGMPPSQIRESFPGEGVLDGAYVIHPEGLKLSTVIGKTLIPGCAPKVTPKPGEPEPKNVRSISDHCALTLTALFEPV